MSMYIGICVVLLVVASAHAGAGAPNPGKKANGNKRHARGKAAVFLLEQNTTTTLRIASKNKMSPRRMKDELNKDNDLALDVDSERLLYLCEGLAVEEGAVANSSALPDALEPNYLDAFKLHSRVGASRVLYLDFDGHGELPIRSSGQRPIISHIVVLAPTGMLH